MAAWTPIALERDCSATTVPGGQRVLLAEGGEVAIVQRLGGSITVRTEMGTLLRIDGIDADALGLDPIGTAVEIGDGSGDDAAGGEDGPFSMDAVWQALGQVYDPEIPVDIVELGLVYRCEEHPGPLDTRRIEIDMSMTAPGCGMGDVLRGDAVFERVMPKIRVVGQVEQCIDQQPDVGGQRVGMQHRSCLQQADQPLQVEMVGQQSADDVVHLPLPPQRRRPGRGRRRCCSKVYFGYIIPISRRAASLIISRFQGGSQTRSTSTSSTPGIVSSFSRASSAIVIPMPQPGAVSVIRTSSRKPPSGSGIAWHR